MNHDGLEKTFIMVSDVDEIDQDTYIYIDWFKRY